MSMYKSKFSVIICFSLLGFLNFPFDMSAQKKDVIVDKNGVMKWGKRGEEVKGFGVNYTVPFAHAYRSAIKMGVDPKKAIDEDVYHFSRLGFDLYRIHVWDTEISDTLGNLIVNENLDLFDYLLAKLKERDINYVITPIAFWGNGWPEPNDNTPGFSHKYGKAACLTNPDAIIAQENYLYQFLNHVNKYTNVAYKDDPNTIAFEVSNEPHHGEDPADVEKYITKMVNSMKKTGTKKPIFYNVSHSIQYAQNYFNTEIEGGTFQWYPTGLGYQRELKGNYLPNADRYYIPFEDVIKKSGGAKLVYEFDAADIGRSYIYPALARSFREAGIQIATHFSYDPTYLAYANTEYNTHYMNLAYTPQKALSLMVSSKVFHEMPMYKSYGRYPENTSFGPFTVSYEKDLAEYIGEGEIIYTNDTESKISNPSEITKIAGYGNSQLVQYDGMGAYFLDKLEDGIWRLEVMPDAIWVANPFGRNSPKKKVAEIVWATRNLTLALPDLGIDFSVLGINEGNSFREESTGSTLSITPGTYLVKRKGLSTDLSSTTRWKGGVLGQFHAPPSTLEKLYVLHQAPEELTAGKEYTLSVEIISPDDVNSAMVSIGGGFRSRNVELNRGEGFTYHATLPTEAINPGFLDYTVIVNTESGTFTYPGAYQGGPRDWDYHNQQSYRTRIVQASNPIYLFDAERDADVIIRAWLPGITLQPTETPSRSEYVVNVSNLENSAYHDYTFRHNFESNVAHRKADLGTKGTIVIKGRSLNDKPCTLQVGLLMNDGSTHASTAILNSRGEYEIRVSDLKLVPTVTLPRPYPGFLDYYSLSKYTHSIDLSKTEAIVFSIGPGIPENEYSENHGVAIESVYLK